jgi:hypothetical protein
MPVDHGSGHKGGISGTAAQARTQRKASGAMPKAGDDPSERLLKGEEWEKTGVFAPQNRKKLGICAGLTVVIGAAAAFVVVMDPFGSDDVPKPEPSSPLAFAGGFYVDPNHNAPGTLNGNRQGSPPRTPVRPLTLARESRTWPFRSHARMQVRA